VIDQREYATNIVFCDKAALEAPRRNELCRTTPLNNKDDTGVCVRKRLEPELTSNIALASNIGDMADFGNAMTDKLLPFAPKFAVTSSDPNT
jgi:hypothetical protein